MAASVKVPEADFPIDALLAEEDVALSLIVGVEGASYRPLGAAMAVTTSGRRTGNLSSGCIDEDVALNARQALQNGEPVRLRYGAGSPFIDLQLPCGGGLDILIIPRPKRLLLQAMRDRLQMRNSACVRIDPEGRLSQDLQGDGLVLEIVPETRILIFGSGPEAETFAAMSQGAGYLVEHLSPRPEENAGSARPLRFVEWPQDLAVDPWTAVTLFFHDHSYEPAILEAALRSPAFYIGAQGSLRARLQRNEALRACGVSETEIQRLAKPFGLIPSARDPRTLAVAVLADVLLARKLEAERR